MAEDLWRLRKQRQMTVKQLAAKSGVPAASIYEYERGQAIRAADLPRLAKALFVGEFDIKIRSDPVTKEPKQEPATLQPPPGQPAAVPTEAQPPAARRPPKPKREPTPPAMARPTQLDHLLQLASLIGQTKAEVAAEVGKPLEELTAAEARQWLSEYTGRMKSEERTRPPGTRRTRAHLPEGVDSFEMNYLEASQEAGDTLAFKLLNGEEYRGRVVGFSPYTITIQPAEGGEITLYKLALAYYQKEGG